MNKYIGLALGLAIVPVMLALPASAASKATPQQAKKGMTTTQQTRIQTTTQTTRATTTTPVAAADLTVENGLAKAQWELVSRHYPQAAQQFEALVSQQPNNVRALNGLALVMDQQGRYNEAFMRIEQALTLDPIRTELYLTRAQILDHMNQPQEALESYLHFAALAPNDTSVLQAQRRADELFRQVEPTLSETDRQYLQGLHLLSLQLPEQAIPMLEKAEALTKDNAHTNMMYGILLGRAELERNQPEQAIQRFEMAVKRETQNPLAYYELGHTYDLVGQHDKARQSWEKLLKVAPHSEAAMRLNPRLEASSNN